MIYFFIRKFFSNIFVYRELVISILTVLYLTYIIANSKEKKENLSVFIPKNYSVSHRNKILAIGHKKKITGYGLQKEQKLQAYLKIWIQIQNMTRHGNSDVFSFTVNSNQTCLAQKVTLLIIVLSSPVNVKKRNEIRNTWGKRNYYMVLRENRHIKLQFLIGEINMKKKHKVEELLREEQEQHQDIIRGKFVDSYYNLTLKTLSMLNWAIKYCPQTKYLLKIDDDVELSVSKLLNLFESLEETLQSHGMKFLLGYKINKYQQRKNPRDKWFNPFTTNYNGSFLSGPAYVISGKLLSSLWENSKRVPFLHLEDVYTTGILANSTGAKLIHSKDFCHLLSKRYNKTTTDHCITKHIYFK